VLGPCARAGSAPCVPTKVAAAIDSSKSGASLSSSQGPPKQKGGLSCVGPERVEPDQRLKHHVADNGKWFAVATLRPIADRR